MKHECDQLKSKTLDRKTNEVINELKQSLESHKAKMKSTVKRMKTSYRIVVHEKAKVKQKLQSVQEQMAAEQDEVIPRHIREQIKEQIKDWQKKDDMFVATRASDYVIKCLENHNCVTLTAPAGVGKSFIARHTALLLRRTGYKIIPVYLPIDIRNYYQPAKQTVFIVDDICGNFTANQQQIENWKQLLPLLNTIIADKCCKIIVSCRLQVYKDDKFNMLPPFKLCECNLISDELRLISEEKIQIANMYMGTRDDGVYGMYMACQEGETTIVNMLLENNPNLDLCDNEGVTALYWACYEGHTAIVKMIIEKNHQVNICNNNGRSPLYRACVNGYTDIVRLLLETDAYIDLCDNFHCSPLYMYTLIRSCIKNNISIVQLLIDHKPNMNAQTYDGGNALYFSALNGNRGITQLLLENNADSNICIHSKQCIAYTLPNHPRITLEQEKQAFLYSFDKSTSSNLKDYVSKMSVDDAFDVVAGSTLLHIACFMGRTDIVLCLLDHSANINMAKEDGTTPLFYACEVGHHDIVRILLDKGANLEMCRLDNKSPLNIATDNRHDDVVEMVTNYQKININFLMLALFKCIRAV
ncbi:unnamed protein product [Mytilus edulis]|uniref:Novel STAND NTPase 3 domain-containing protein n=1 Tax=Mytilus edulis TaxID=6550 RepID=A0A8S3QXP7_MYTED|nr:unnamed protein product [Mytilus edulis]